MKINRFAHNLVVFFDDGTQIWVSTWAERLIKEENREKLWKAIHELMKLLRLRYVKVKQYQKRVIIQFVFKELTVDA